MNHEKEKKSRKCILWNNKMNHIKILNLSLRFQNIININMIGTENNKFEFFFFAILNLNFIYI